MTVLKLPILEVNAQDYHQFNSFFYFALKAILLLWKKNEGLCLNGYF